MEARDNVEQNEGRNAQNAQRNGDGLENRKPNRQTVSALDTLIPVIPSASLVNIKSRFKHQKLTPISGKPNHSNLEPVNNELAQSAITSKTIFGCPKRGCLGALKSGEVYLKIAGVE